MSHNVKMFIQAKSIQFKLFQPQFQTKLEHNILAIMQMYWNNWIGAFFPLQMHLWSR